MVALFEELSGLKINRSKCTILGINTNALKLQRWVEVFDCEVGFFPSMYLGLPLGDNPRAMSFWDSVCEKI